MANIDDEQKWRPPIGARYRADIAIGLIAGAQHGVIPARTAALAVALPLFRGIGQKGKLNVIGGGAMNALLGLRDERPAPVQIDQAA